MINKKMIIIPPLSGFRNALGIHDRKVKVAVFVPDRNCYPDLSLLETS